MLVVLIVYCVAAQENPELVWNDEAREKVQNVVKRMKLRYGGNLMM